MRHPRVPTILQHLKGRFDGAKERTKFRLGLRHIYGPKSVEVDSESAVAVCLIRDGEYYLERLLDHHFALGIRHVVLCDNGSTDRTFDIARRYKNVSVLQCELPMDPFENIFRRYAAERFSGKGWCLFIDMDEILDFPFRKEISLTRLLKYLNNNDFSAVVGQMLELYPRNAIPLNNLLSYSSSIGEYNWYEIENIIDLPYFDDSIDFKYFLNNNALSSNAVNFKFGGVRRRVFGENCCLTKHALVRPAAGAIPGVHPHTSSNVHCAPFTCLIRHYKFTANFVARDQDIIARKVLSHPDNKIRLDYMAGKRDLQLWTEGSRLLGDPYDLVQTGFLVDPQGVWNDLRSSKNISFENRSSRRQQIC